MSKWTPRGQMRRQITIQQIDTTSDTNGETVNTASTFSTTWSRIAPGGGSEIYRGNAQQNTSTHEIRTPYIAGVTAKMQATYQGRIFNFTSVNDIDELHRELKINAIEVSQ